MNRFPSALSREQSSGGMPDSSRKEPTAAQVAMMTFDQYKVYIQRRGETEERSDPGKSPDILEILENDVRE